MPGLPYSRQQKIKKKRGKALMFKTPEALAEAADAYFGNTPQNEWTVTGLALALGTTRETLMQYQRRKEFNSLIERYKEMVHNAYELDLRRKGRSGDIFALKNFGWKDRQEVDNTHSFQQPILGGQTKHAIRGDNSDPQIIEAEEED